MLADLDILEQIPKGGVIAVAIVALSVVLLTLTIVHLLTLRHATQCPDELLDAVQSEMRRRRWRQALELLESDPSALAVVIERAVRGLYDQPQRRPAERSRDPGPDTWDTLRESLAEGTAEQSLLLTQRISWVALVASVAPMMGLLGTVSGMVHAFATMSATAGSPEPSVLAGAISEALITTYLGLAVAIPALVLHAVLRHRVLNIVLRISQMCEALVADLVAHPPSSEVNVRGVGSRTT